MKDFDVQYAKLNSQQRKAVEAVHGRVLILAGAGSGKTLVLTLRMAHLIKNLNIPAKHILGLTFTNKAADEMRKRLASFIDSESAKQVTLCTFHSFCMQILRQEAHRLGYTTKFSLYDEQDLQRLVKLIARDMLQQEKDLPSLASTMAAIQQAKNKGLSPEQMPATTSEWHHEFTCELYRRLQASMRAYNAVDFDHLLSLTVELFERFPDVLSSYQNRFQYIMIDEYQDTNPVQYRLAALLSSKHHHLCVVGDDDQSIYGWRGANIKNILDFDQAVIIKLEQNYRSTNTILQAANSIIANNQTRHAKALWSDKGNGHAIEVFFAPTELDEAQAVVKRLIKVKELHQLQWRDIAILYRSNALSRQFEFCLMREMWKSGDRWVQGIPYQIFGGLDFYERREVKDLCAYLRVIVNPQDQDALLRIINQPRRGIGEDSLDVLTTYNRKTQRPLWDVLQAISKKNSSTAHLEISAKSHKGIIDFIDVLESAKDRFDKGKLAEGLCWLIQKIDYRKAIMEEVKSDRMRDLKWENVQEFVSSLAHFEEMYKGKGLEDFVSESMLDHQAAFYAKDKSNREDRVNLMTFHSAKGLEFPICFLVGIEDHIIPHEKSLLETGLEEERRLMYVAITRAKQALTISFAKQRKRMGQDHMSRPSRFLFEIPKELIKTTDWRLT